MVEKSFILLPYTVGYTIGKGFHSDGEDSTQNCAASPFKDEADLVNKLNARAVVSNDEIES